MRTNLPVTAIGRCAACLSMAAVEHQICHRCRRRFGDRFAVLIARVRREPDFARACFERVGPEHRDRFLAAL